MKITVKQLKQLIREALEETATSLDRLEQMHSEDPQGQHSAVFDFEELLKGKTDLEIMQFATNLDEYQRANLPPKVRTRIIDALRTVSDELKAKGIQAESALLKNIVRRAVRSELKK